ncbi:MAG TPA: hypothetical protein VF381_13425, partial [Thermoanaerobaculia bacterium]
LWIGFTTPWSVIVDPAGEIDNSINTLRVVQVPKVNAAQGNTLVTLVQRAVAIYTPLIPLLMVLSGTSLLPAAWRAGLTLLIQTLDALASAVPPITPSSPVTESAAADTTTTDPTSTDPSFKAGKDL